jgi:ABC-type ATPase with predicted acetyltransferase domain
MPMHAAGLNSGKVCTPANTILRLQSSIIPNFPNDAAVPTTSYCLDREDDIDKDGDIEAMRNVVTEIRVQDSLREARPRETSEEEEINAKLADLVSVRNFVLIVGQSITSNS